jgi:hypothetical protein
LRPSALCAVHLTAYSGISPSYQHFVMVHFVRVHFGYYSETSKDPRKYWTSRPGSDRDALERDRRERALTPAPLRAPSGAYPTCPHDARRNRPARDARRSERGCSLSTRVLSVSAQRCAGCFPILHPKCQQVPSSPDFPPSRLPGADGSSPLQNPPPSLLRACAPPASTL